MRNLFTKRLLISTAAVTMLFGSAITANAAQEDLFDADYYAETYADVAEAVGYDADALLQHYLAYGITEGRSASAYFNALTYRNANADLDVAFGDDWDAYADHYIAFGVSEGRNAGGERAITDAEYAAAAAGTAEQTQETTPVEDIVTADTSVPIEEATETTTTETAVTSDVDFYINGVGIKMGVTSVDTVTNALAGASVSEMIADENGNIGCLNVKRGDALALISIDGQTAFDTITPSDVIDAWGQTDDGLIAYGTRLMYYYSGTVSDASYSFYFQDDVLQDFYAGLIFEDEY